MKLRPEAALVGVVLILLPFAVSPSARAAGSRHPLARARRIETKLKAPIDCDFEETPFPEALDYLRNTLGINIVYDPAADAEDKLVTLRLTDAPAQDLLGWIVRLAGLSYSVVGNVVYVGPRGRPAPTARSYFRQYDVNDVLAPLGGLLNNNNNNSNNNNDGNRNNDNRDRRRGTRPERELMALIIIFTGGPSNWDYFEVMGAEDDADDDSVSREDSF